MHIQPPDQHLLKPLLGPTMDDTHSLPQEEETQQPSARRRNRNAWWRPRVYLPVIIILGQSFFLLGGWAFFLATQAKPTPLPNKLAIAIRGSPESATFIITQIAALISIITACLYSNAVRYTVAMSLSRPMSLFVLASSMKIAGSTLVLNFRRWKWTISALICATALSFQTAGWTTLLMPKPIQIRTSLTGFGIDLHNEQVITKANSDVSSRALRPHLFINVGPLLINSGTAAVSAMYGQTSDFLFNDMTFKSSTAGILLVNMWPMLSAIANRTSAELPVNTQLTSPANMIPGFQRNYTVTQQDFTADIRCERRALNESTSPSLVGPIVAPIISNDTLPLVATSIQGACRDGQPISYQHTTLPGQHGEAGDTIFAELCILDDTPEFELILVGYGNYWWIEPTVCSISPKVTLVDVHYTQSNLSVSRPDTVRIDPPRDSQYLSNATFAPYMLMSALYSMQGLTGHAFGDAISSFYYARARNSGDEAGNLNKIVEAFLTSTFELMGTLVRASYTETSNAFWGEAGEPIPEEFRYTTTGTFVTETIGWHQTITTLPKVLLASTFVTGVSIILVIMTLIRIPRNLDVDGQDYFDLNNILHVISATSAGEFNDPFPSVRADEGDHDLHSEKVRVKLGYTKSGGFGLIQQSNV